MWMRPFVVILHEVVKMHCRVRVVMSCRDAAIATISALFLM